MTTSTTDSRVVVVGIGQAAFQPAASLRETVWGSIASDRALPGPWAQQQPWFDRCLVGSRGCPTPLVTCNIGRMASTRERVREHRQRLRALGLRPVQIWVPDVRAPEFVAEAHRQSAAIAASEHEAEDQDFVDAISVDWASEGTAGE